MPDHANPLRYLMLGDADYQRWKWATSNLRTLRRLMQQGHKLDGHEQRVLAQSVHAIEEINGQMDSKARSAPGT